VIVLEAKKKQKKSILYFFEHNYCVQYILEAIALSHVESKRRTFLWNLFSLHQKNDNFSKPNDILMLFAIMLTKNSCTTREDNNMSGFDRH
jgi:hypothetical protein